jgi:hypothetical protein
MHRRATPILGEDEPAPGLQVQYAHRQTDRSFSRRLFSIDNGEIKLLIAVYR